MPSGGVGLITGCLRAGCGALVALLVSACGSSPPPAGPGGCAPGTASGVLCPAVGAVCGYQAPNGFTSCTCENNGKWSCDTAQCPGGPPHPGSDCPAALQGMVCNYPGEGCQCVAGGPHGYQWVCR